MKPAGTKKNSTNVAHVPHNEVECLSLRCQFGHCFGGSTVNKIAPVTVDKSVPVATANRASLTQLLASNSGGSVFIVALHPNGTTAQINAGRALKLGTRTPNSRSRRRRTQSEHNESACLPTADIGADTMARLRKFLVILVLILHY